MTDLTLRGHYIDRFWSRVDTRDMNGCHPWTAGKLPAGYGYMSVDPSPGCSLAHRIAYHNLVGPIPEGMTIDHICHNTACVNVDHLRLATDKEQMQNISGAYKNSKSGVLGVRRRGTGGWNARIGLDYGEKSLGIFGTIEEATAARKAAEIKYNWFNKGVK